MDGSERFYTFRHNSHETRGFTWAVSIVPKSKVVTQRCDRCGYHSEYPGGEFDVIVEGGIKYPDVLGCGAYPFLIVSEKVVNAWHDAGITQFHTYRVGIAAVKSKRLAGVTPPAFYRVEIDGRCRINLAASGFRVVHSCPACGHIRVSRSDLQNFFLLAEESWDGSPIFRDVEFFPNVNFCTSLALDVAQRHKLTNFRFQLMQASGFRDKRIDYMKGER